MVRGVDVCMTGVVAVAVRLGRAVVVRMVAMVAVAVLTDASALGTHVDLCACRSVVVVMAPVTILEVVMDKITIMLLADSRGAGRPRWRWTRRVRPVGVSSLSGASRRGWPARSRGAVVLY